MLDGFHAAIRDPALSLPARYLLAAIPLAAAFSVPLLGLRLAVSWSHSARPTARDLRARRLAYATIATPSLYIFLNASFDVLGLSAATELVWPGLWTVVATFIWPEQEEALPTPAPSPCALLRIAHGISAFIISCFVLIHIFNQTYGLLGPDTYVAVMNAGRGIYSSSLVEPVLVLLMLFQVLSGILLFWRWSALKADFYRVFQLASGLYLAVFILTHLGSMFIYKSIVHHSDTGWDYTSIAPMGHVREMQNTRLLPYYAWAILFALGHLASGMREVALAHGVDERIANRSWTAGVGIAAFMSAAVTAGLCGQRL
jgi:succinate dehydrogenase hydrophobic anchor subunit